MDRDQIQGGLYGLLVGDALGVPYEFHPAAAIPEHGAIDLVPPRGFPRAHPQVPPGTWSDDGAQALCLLASLLERGALVLDDFAARLLRWRREGYMAVDGRVFDCGIQTDRALSALGRGEAALSSGPAGERDNGNGSLMRVLPLALWHRGSDEALVADAAKQSLPTHGHLRSQLCCGLYCLWARREAERAPDPWANAVATMRRLHIRDSAAMRELEGPIGIDRPAGGGGSGYVVDCLHTARLALEAADFAAVLRRAVAIGNDTDTTAAVAGGIAGIRHGHTAIPAGWLAGLRGRGLVEPLLDRLCSSEVR
jgi:ADP-ribosylglycohydrolase